MAKDTNLNEPLRKWLEKYIEDSEKMFDEIQDKKEQTISETYKPIKEVEESIEMFDKED